MTVKATFWFMICNIVQKGISVITTPIFTRLLTTKQYGEYTLFQSWLAIFTLICTFRLNYSVFTKGLSKYPKERNEFTLSIQSTMTIVTTVIFFIYLLFHSQINSLTDMTTFVTMAMFVEIYFQTSIQIWSLRERYEFNYKVIILPTLLLALMNPLVGIIAVYFSQEKGLARIISGVIVQVIFGLIFYIINIRKGKYKLFNKSHAKFALLFNLPLIPHYFSTYVLEQADRIMIEKICGLSEAAIYGVAYNAGTLMKIITDAVNNSIVPWIYQKLELKEYKKIEKYIFSVLVIICCVSIVFISLAPEIISILAGKKYAQAVYIIPPVAASMFFTFFFSLVSNIEFYYDANKFTMYISMIGAGLNILLNYIFINMYGFIAAGYTTLACYAFFGISHYLYMTYIVRRKVGIVILAPMKILGLSIMLIVFVIGISLIYEYTLIRYAIFVLLLIGLYVKREIILNVFLRHINE